MFSAFGLLWTPMRTGLTDERTAPRLRCCAFTLRAAWRDNGTRMPAVDAQTWRPAGVIFWAWAANAGGVRWQAGVGGIQCRTQGASGGCLCGLALCAALH